MNNLIPGYTHVKDLEIDCSDERFQGVLLQKRFFEMKLRGEGFVFEDVLYERFGDLPWESIGLNFWESSKLEAIFPFAKVLEVLGEESSFEECMVYWFIQCRSIRVKKE